MGVGTSCMVSCIVQCSSCSGLLLQHDTCHMYAVPWHSAVLSSYVLLMLQAGGINSDAANIELLQSAVTAEVQKLASGTDKATSAVERDMTDQMVSRAQLQLYCRVCHAVVTKHGAQHGWLARKVQQAVKQLKCVMHTAFPCCSSGCQSTVRPLIVLQWWSA